MNYAAILDHPLILAERPRERIRKAGYGFCADTWNVEAFCRELKARTLER